MLAIPRRKIDFKANVFKKSLNYVLFGRQYDGSLERFEKRFLDYLGVSYAFGVSSARKGLALCLRVLELENEDEIILASFNYFAIPAVICALGFTPVFVDVEKDTGNIDSNLIEQKITPKTKAIIVTYMFGRICNMDHITKIAKKYKLFLIEDCAQALGAELKGKKAGTFGDFGIFSFGIGKAVMSFGGGMIVTNSKELANKIRDERGAISPISKIQLTEEIFKHFLVYIFTKKIIFNVTVFFPLKIIDRVFHRNLLDFLFGERPASIKSEFCLNGAIKMNDFQAEIGLSQLELVDIALKRRIDNSILLYKNLQGLGVNLRESSDKEHAYLNYKILANRRDFLRSKLLSFGIDTQREDMHACHALSLMHKIGSDCFISEILAMDLLGIPHYPGLKPEEINHICESLRKVLM